MNANKAPDTGEIAVVALHIPTTQEALLSIYNAILDGCPPSQAFQHTLMVPIYKKGRHNNWNNYRSISLKSTALKLFTRIPQSPPRADWLSFVGHLEQLPEEQILRSAHS